MRAKGQAAHHVLARGARWARGKESGNIREDSIKAAGDMDSKNWQAAEICSIDAHSPAEPAGLFNATMPLPASSTLR